uniref:Uncharacterized protein n=1 Tax=Pithovirus LCPAC401 TaxID=2506595 RepID=A0A481Z9R4_9VIRU|nr:MAG: uncharacterized protein LCPAC401_02760 [Pithovirus LCPAC401]
MKSIYLKLYLDTKMDKYDEWMCCFAGCMSYVIPNSDIFEYSQFMVEKAISTYDEIAEFIRDKSYYLYVKEFSNSAGHLYKLAQDESTKSGLQTILLKKGRNYEMLNLFSLLLDIGYLTDECFDTGDFVAVGKEPVMINRFMNDIPANCVAVAKYLKNIFVLTYVHKLIKYKVYKSLCLTDEGLIHRTIRL